MTKLSIEEAQQLLPSGLELKQELVQHDGRTPAALGQVFRAEDHRLGSANKVGRAVRIVCHDAEDVWWSKFLDRCRTLTEHHSHGIARPVEVCQPRQGVLFQVTDWFPTNVAAQLPPQGLKSPTQVWTLIEQLAGSLAELHANGLRPSLAHGDVCLENAFLDSAPLTPTSRVCLGDAGVSHLPIWSNGKRFANRMCLAFPPEWHQALQSPTAAADVYALGVMAVQLLLGTAAVEQALKSQTAARAGLWKSVEPAVRKKLGFESWRHRQWLSRALAMEPARRFANGRVAREALPGSVWQSTAARLIAALVMFVLIGIAVERSVTADMLRQDRQTAILDAEQQRKEAEQSKNETVKLYRDKSEWQGRFDRAEQEIAGLKVKLELAEKGVPEHPVKPPPVPSNEELAQDAWRELSRRLGVQWENFGKELDLLATESSLKPETLKLIKEWAKEVNSGLAFWQPWIDRARPEEMAFVESWTKFSNSPWHSATRAQAEKDREALTIGSDIWAQYANEPRDSWETFCRKLNSAADAKEKNRVKTLFNAWIGAFDRKRKWSLRIHSAKAPKGYGTKRYVSTFNGDEKNRYSEWLTWPTDEGIDPPGKKSDRTRDIDWKVGDPLVVWVEGERTYLGGYLPDLLDNTFQGPVVLWTLRNRSTISGKGPGQLELEVEKCPGPP